MSNNTKLWDEVCKTDPKNTKKANVRGNKITAIAPQSQIYSATKQFGPYGSRWGFKSVDIDYTLIDVGLVVFKGDFYYPGGGFEIFSSISIYRDNAKTKLDDDFAKKVETDTLTKALSKIGFNADIFMGMYEDHRYMQQLNEEMAQAEYEKFCENLKSSINAIKEGIESGDLSSAAEAWFELTDQEKTDIWRAPSKGGIFTTIERSVIKTTEFREAHFGVNDAG